MRGVTLVTRAEKSSIACLMSGCCSIGVCGVALGFGEPSARVLDSELVAVVVARQGAPMTWVKSLERSAREVSRPGRRSSAMESVTVVGDQSVMVASETSAKRRRLLRACASVRSRNSACVRGGWVGAEGACVVGAGGWGWVGPAGAAGVGVSRCRGGGAGSSRGAGAAAGSIFLRRSLRRRGCR